MIMVKQKICGWFRTLDSARCPARIRAYLSICRKLGFKLWDALFQAAIGSPFMRILPNSAQPT